MDLSYYVALGRPIWGHGDPKSSILGGLAASLSNFSHSFNMLLFSITLGLILTSMSPKVLLENLYGIVPHAM